MFNNYYKILGLNPGASDEDIKKAYKKLALQYHPDRNKENSEIASDKFKEISNAYQNLTNKDKNMQNINMASGTFINPHELFAQFFNMAPGMSNTNSRTNSTFEINIGGNMNSSNISQKSIQTTIVNGKIIDTITEIRNGVVTKKTIVRQL